MKTTGSNNVFVFIDDFDAVLFKSDKFCKCNKINKNTAFKYGIVQINPF